MSDYGKLWEKANDVRARLKTIAPWIDTDTLDKATASAKRQVKVIEGLLNQWQNIEQEMAHCDDHTGNSMTRVPDDKELGRCGREDLLNLVKALRDERDKLQAELSAFIHHAKCDCPTCAVGVGPW